MAEFNFSVFLAKIVTFAPSLNASLATSLPIPLDPPVTSTYMSSFYIDGFFKQTIQCQTNNKNNQQKVKYEKQNDQRIHF